MPGLSHRDGNSWPWLEKREDPPQVPNIRYEELGERNGDIVTNERNSNATRVEVHSQVETSLCQYDVCALSRQDCPYTHSSVAKQAAGSAFLPNEVVGGIRGCHVSAVRRVYDTRTSWERHKKTAKTTV